MIPSEPMSTKHTPPSEGFPVPEGLRIPEAPERGVIWHFSDLHFPPEPVKLGRTNPGKHDVDVANDAPFQEIFDYVSQVPEQWKGGFLVVSGDFVEATRAPDVKSRARAFSQAKRFVKGLEASLETGSSGAHCIVVVCPGNHDVDFAVASTPGGDPLAQFRSAFGRHVSPGKKPSTDTRGACLLTLDTTRLCGRKLEVAGVTETESGTVFVQFDASVFDRREIERTLRKLHSRDSTVLSRIARGHTLGVVVGHHQPTLTPSVWPELRPYEHPAAAAQMKYDLSRKGFRIFLHGHKHTSVAHHEAIFPLNRAPAEGLLVLGAPAFLASGGEDRGFNVIEYLVSPGAGEARVLLHPHTLVQTRPVPLASRRFDLPPCAGALASTIRLTAVIDDQGDCRLDSEYIEIPLPTHHDSRGSGGWQLSSRRWERNFQRQFVSDLNVGSRPLIRSLSPGVTAEFTPGTGHESNVGTAYSIKLSAPKSGRATHASFVERVFMHGAFAVSCAHQVRIGGTQSRIPGVEKGREAIMHVMREPSRRLEIFVEMPFALEREDEVEVKAYVARDGYFVEDPALFDFSPYHIAANFPTQRLFVSIDSPVVGVAYVVRWKLPENDPVHGEPLHLTNHRLHTENAQLCRQRVYECRNPNVASEILDMLKGHVDRALSPLPLTSSELISIHWSVYVPEKRLFTPAGSERRQLVPALASQPLYANWRHWEAGRGVAGRAYALNRVIEEIGPTSGRYREPSEREHWLKPAVRAYERGSGKHDHSVLYGIPLRAPDHPALTWGVFCIGTWREHAAFDLLAKIPGAGFNTAPATGLHLLETELEEFSRRLIRL